MKKCAIYCRVSSDDQRERDTIENQVEILHSYIEMKKDDLEFYDQYLDNGISGTIPFENRPEGSKLIKDASKGLFNVVLVWKIDRFGRDTLSGLNAVEQFSKYKIEILSMSEPFDAGTPTGRFQIITYLNMAELERNNILDRMFIGATRAAKKGKWMGGIVPYGYIVNKDGYLEINEDEAKIIKKIFDLYVNEKLSSISIAIYLNTLEVPTSCSNGKGKRTKNVTLKWRSSTVLRMLSSTTYKGIHFYGKHASRRTELIKRAVPAIISVEIWDKVQIIKKSNIIMSKRNNNKRNYLLRGLIKCKQCGKNYYGISYKDRGDIYSCNGKRGENKRIFGIKCDNLNLPADMIEKDIWSDCLHILNHYGEYIKAIKNSPNSHINSITDELNLLKKSLTSKKTEKNNIITLYRKNIINKEEIEYQIKDIRDEENKILNLINALERKNQIFEHEDELITKTSNKLKIYYNKIDNLSFDDKYGIVKLLVKEIKTETIIDNGERIPSYSVVYNLVKLGVLTDVPAVITEVIASPASVAIMKRRDI